MTEFPYFNYLSLQQFLIIIKNVFSSVKRRKIISINVYKTSNKVEMIFKIFGLSCCDEWVRQGEFWSKSYYYHKR